MQLHARAEAKRAEAASLEEPRRLDADAAAARALVLSNSVTAVGVQNFHVLYIPSSSTPTPTKYSRWRGLFFNTL